MMNEVFSIQILTKKLTNLNNSQQSIETLSRWCILHRKKAKQVVETWDTMFSNLLKEKGVSLMYLANDILQNSRRKGNEFVNEFWKVLPGALKCIYESGDDREKNVVTRLVDIWEERKVFGSRGQTLKDEMLGKDLLPSVENNEKSSQAIKIVKKDANSIRIKLPVGCLPEKIVSAFRLVHDEESNEENVLNKCKAAVEHLGKIEGAFDTACAQGNQESTASMNEFLEQEAILKKYIEQLETLEATRASLVSHLKEAISEQETKWGDICRVLQVAKAEVDYITSLKQKSTSPSVAANPSVPATPAKRKGIADVNPPYQVGNTVMQPSAQSSTFASSSSSSSKAIADPKSLNHVGSSVVLPSTQSTFANSTTSTEDRNKKTAAEVAAKLASMTSSAQVLTSVISSLVAEEAASMNGGPKSGSFSTSSSILPPTKRPKLEKPMQISESSNVQVSQVHVQPSSMPPVPPVNSASQPLVNPQQLIFPPLPPSMPSSRPQIPAYGTQSSGGITGAVPYSFGGSSLSPPPPPPAHVLLGLMRSGPQSVAPPQLSLQQPQPLQQPQLLQQPQALQQPQPLQQQPQQQMLPPPPAQLPPPPMQQQQQQQSSAGFFPTSGMGFYGQPPPGSAGPSQSHQR